MPLATVVEQLAAARLDLDRAGELLLSPSPEALDRCSSVLEAAGRRTEHLLQGAGDFYCNWISLRGAMTGGYTSAGDPAPVLHGHRISLQG